ESVVDARLPAGQVRGPISPRRPRRGRQEPQRVPGELYVAAPRDDPRIDTGPEGLLELDRRTDGGAVGVDLQPLPAAHDDQQGVGLAARLNGLVPDRLPDPDGAELIRAERPDFHRAILEPDRQVTLVLARQEVDAPAHMSPARRPAGHLAREVSLNGV